MTRKTTKYFGIYIQTEDGLNWLCESKWGSVIYFGRRYPNANQIKAYAERLRG